MEAPSGEVFGAEQQLLSPHVRAERAAARPGRALRAVQLLGLSGPQMQASLTGRLVAASSAVCLGDVAYAADLFAETWAQGLAGQFGRGQFMSRSPLARSGPRRGNLALLFTMKRAALVTGSATLYAQAFVWGNQARLPAYCDAYETSTELRIALFAGHSDLVQAMMAARGAKHTPLELASTVAFAHRAVADAIARGAADAPHLELVQTGVAAIVAVLTPSGPLNDLA